MEVIGCDDTGQVRKVHFYAHLQLLLQPVWLYHISHLARKGLHLVVTNAKKKSFLMVPNDTATSTSSKMKI